METIIKVIVVSDDPSPFRRMKNAGGLPPGFGLEFKRRDMDILPALREGDVKIVIVDIDGTKKEESLLLRRLKRFDPLLDVLMIGRPSGADEVVNWIGRGATDCLSKPVDAKALRAALERIAGRRSLRRETLVLEKKIVKKYVFQGMISRNPAMLEVFGLIEKISGYFSGVLITGETGTGKEMAARAIHQLSPARGGKLVVCDCASVPESLFESELFGYARGAFTGADTIRKGLFEEADGGAMFLDEIAEIPVSIQAKLLRVLENRQFRPLGSNANKTVHVRIIAATSRNLRESIRTGAFREDLFHRLNKVEIHLPPLRERLEDIPLLVRSFLDQNGKRFEKAIQGVSRPVQKAFLRYPWPGNVRELFNVLESACLVCRKEFIDIQDLPEEIQKMTEAEPRMALIDKKRLPSLDDMEKEYISYVLKTTGRNLKKAARILGVSRTTLYSKIEKFHIAR